MNVTGCEAWIQRLIFRYLTAERDGELPRNITWERKRENLKRSSAGCREKMQTPHRGLGLQSTTFLLCILEPAVLTTTPVCRPQSTRQWVQSSAWTKAQFKIWFWVWFLKMSQATSCVHSDLFFSSFYVFHCIGQDSQLMTLIFLHILKSQFITQVSVRCRVVDHHSESSGGCILRIIKWKNGWNGPCVCGFPLINLWFHTARSLLRLAERQKHAVNNLSGAKSKQQVGLN